MHSLEERIASLEAKASSYEKSLDRAEEALTKRFEAGNEIRQAMQDQTRQYVTRQEFQWAIGAVVVTLIGMIVKLVTG